ncbi:TrbG/VirB9 family P-type conjugative transfer protein [Comamonas thiooxydans]|uniref:TrbG/VirB9 family P-type conjugative transfer protein n=1 Tax=Comamonas thiooxydans TaxID=363952 RepID=UPI00050F0DCA|nr:TrbG/VirB9 family P-type conjugative transfer protein [Comamonas thiooxydans]KGH23047.1 hypothetical protein P606_13515 [Comamonas thiooxydans]
MKTISKMIVASSLLLSFAAVADTMPTPIYGDARLVVFEYNPEKVYPVLTRPLAVTNIVLPKGEKIRLMKAGDTFSFMIEADKSLNEIFIKPKYDGVETTLTVATTNKRFQFSIRSTGKNRKYYQQVSYAEEPATLFEFGDIAEGPSTNLGVDDKNSNDELKASASRSEIKVNPAELNTKYTISGDASFKPETVYDNGKFIWLKFPERMTELPAIFAKDKDGMYLVNYVPDRANSNVVIVQQMADELLLKIDSQEVSVKKGKRGLFGWSN